METDSELFEAATRVWKIYGRRSGYFLLTLFLHFGAWIFPQKFNPRIFSKKKKKKI